MLTSTYEYTDAPEDLLAMRTAIGEMMDGSIFVDGFESGDASAWSNAAP